MRLTWTNSGLSYTQMTGDGVLKVGDGFNPPTGNQTSKGIGHFHPLPLGIDAPASATTTSQSFVSSQKVRL